MNVTRAESLSGREDVISERQVDSPYLLSLWWAFQVALVVKKLLANAGDIRDSSLISGSARSPGGGHSNPLQYSCLENPMDRGAWWATVHGSQRVGHNWSDLACTHARFPSEMRMEQGGRGMGFTWKKQREFSLLTTVFFAKQKDGWFAKRGERITAGSLIRRKAWTHTACEEPAVRRHSPTETGSQDFICKLCDI